MTRVRRSRGLLWLLLAAALFMRAVMPQGFMAERDAGGTINVRVCGSGHVVDIPLGEQSAPGADERAQQPCAFAGLGAPALPPPPLAELPVPTASGTGYVSVAHGAARVVAPLPHPPARAPPLAA